MIQVDDNFIKNAVQTEAKAQIEKYIKSAEFKKIVDINIKSEMSKWWNAGAVADVVKDVLTKDETYIKNLGETVTNKMFYNIVEALTGDNDDY